MLEQVSFVQCGCNKTLLNTRLTIRLVIAKLHTIRVSQQRPERFQSVIYTGVNNV